MSAATFCLSSLRAVMVAVAFFFAGNAMATCTAISCDNEQILAMMTTSSGDVFVKTSGTMSNLGCTLSEDVYATLVRSDAGFKEMYASLLAHYMASMPISLRIDDNSTGCTIGYIFTEVGP